MNKDNSSYISINAIEFLAIACLGIIIILMANLRSRVVKLEEELTETEEKFGLVREAIIENREIITEHDKIIDVIIDCNPYCKD